MNQKIICRRGPVLGNQSGQGILEYVLLLVIIVAVVLGLRIKFLGPFGNYSRSVLESQFECALEMGELMDSTKLMEDEDGNCVKKFESGDWDPVTGKYNDKTGSNTSGSGSGNVTKGDGKNGSGGSEDASGSSSNKDSNANKTNNGAGAGGDNSSEGGNSGVGANSSVDSGGSRSGGGRGSNTLSPKKISLSLDRNGRPATGVTTGSEDSTSEEVIVEMGDEDAELRGNNRYGRRSRRQSKSVNLSSYIEENKDDENEEKKNSPTVTTQSNTVGGERKPKLIKIEETRRELKVTDDKSNNWDLGKLFRFAIIFLIILAILIFIFFQVAQFLRSSEK